MERERPEEMRGPRMDLVGGGGWICRGGAYARSHPAPGCCSLGELEGRIVPGRVEGWRGGEVEPGVGVGVGKVEALFSIIHAGVGGERDPIRTSALRPPGCSVFCWRPRSLGGGQPRRGPVHGRLLSFLEG